MPKKDISGLSAKAIARGSTRPTLYDIFSKNEWHAGKAFVRGAMGYL
jgi:hypothetical protein